MSCGRRGAQLMQWVQLGCPHLSSRRMSTYIQSSINTAKLINASEEKRQFAQTLPSRAKVVICGGGAQGAAIAYRLAEAGWGQDVLLLEQGELGGGTTWHTTGLLGILKVSPLETRIAAMSRDLYAGLEERGWYTGVRHPGSLYVAKKKDRMFQYRHMCAIAKQNGIEAKLLTPDEVKLYSGLVRTDDLVGGLWVPKDGVANSFEICLALGTEAMNSGVTVVERCRVVKVEQEGGRVTAVDTNMGRVHCDYFVNSAGFWSRCVGSMSVPMVAVPIHPCEHYHLHTKPVPDLPPDTPVIRDPDGCVYFRENEGRFLAGGFEPVAKPAYLDKELPEVRAELEEDWDHFHLLLENMLHRVPTMKTAILERLSNGPEAFSPDGQWILGQSPEINNYYVAAGMRSNGISSAGGVGTVIADWIVRGRPPFDMYGLDIVRFVGMHNNKRFLRDRVTEVPGLNFALQYPHSEFSTGRALRTSPIFPKLQAAGAQFGQVMGYERPMFFKLKRPQSLDMGLAGLDAAEEAANSQGETLALPIARTDSFYRPPWFQAAAEEFQATREAVSLCDYSSFAKMDLWSGGTEVVDFLQNLCSNDVDIPVGHIAHTGMQNKWGGYENDCSVARLAENRFMDIACAPDILTMNMTHTGELGYVFYIPNEFAIHVYDAIIEAGKEFGLKHCGYYAQRAVRIEKFYAYWGQDLDSYTTPMECGRAFRCKMKSDHPFIGRSALQHQLDHGVNKLFVMLLLDPVEHCTDLDPWPWGGESIYRNDKLCGTVTTTSYGFSIGKQICLGFVQDLSGPDNSPVTIEQDFVKQGDFEVEIQGVRYPAHPRLNPPVLPKKVMLEGPGDYQATRHM